MKLRGKGERIVGVVPAKNLWAVLDIVGNQVAVAQVDAHVMVETAEWDEQTRQQVPALRAIPVQMHGSDVSELRPKHGFVRAGSSKAAVSRARSATTLEASL